MLTVGALIDGMPSEYAREYFAVIRRHDRPWDGCRRLLLVSNEG